MFKRYSSLWETHLITTERHLPYEIAQCYLPPDTDKRAAFWPLQDSTQFIYAGETEGWVNIGGGYVPKWLTCVQTVTHLSDSTESRILDLSIVSRSKTNRYFTKY